MKIHLDELEMAREYTRGHAFEDLSSEQTRLILDRGRELYKLFKAHPRTHALINALVIVSLLALVIGGGPWGQPCHMAHHLVASIPWYQQIVLHRFIVALLTEKQRRQFLLPPGLGFSRLLWRVVRDANAFSRAAGRTT
jgi:hypothetical protein